MNCPDCEKLIYTFQELKGTEQEKIIEHIKTCESCKSLFDEVQAFSRTVKKVNLEIQSIVPSGQLINNVMDSISGIRKDTKARSLFDLSISRYALAAISCGILILFFMEILVPGLKSGKIKGPISNVQGAIIKSEDFRKVFTRPKEKKSLLDGCKNILSQQVDVNCVKEKLSKLNLQ